MKKRPRIFSDFERIATLIPAPVFWSDDKGVVLGSNDLAFQGAGAAQTRERILGKTPYDFYPEDVAKVIMQNTMQVIRQKKALTLEEVITDIVTGKKRWFLTTRAPLYDDDGINVVGTIGTSVEITDRKESERLRIETELHKAKLKELENFRKLVDQTAHDTQAPLAILLVLVQHCIGLTKEKIFETIRQFSDFIPTSVCWLDANNVIVGMNKRALEDIGGTSHSDFAGRSLYDLHPYELADPLVKHNNQVMQTGKILNQEGAVTVVTTGEIKYFSMFKAPLYDDTGKLVGILGVSVDITSEKEAENLKLENELQRVKLNEQEKFRHVTDQVVHDIRSPLASLLMIVKSCENDFPEQTRVALREAAISIGDIANNLLCRYEEDHLDSSVSLLEESQPTMITLALLQVLSEKKQQYKKSPIKFTSDFCQECNFAFIKVEPVAFKRMISNLVNNAVEALDGKEEGQGKVDINLNLDGEYVKIIIQDNGKGIPQEVIDKIMNNVPVTAGKKGGHGIGFTQIRETLERNQGTLKIDSEISKGTKIILTFPIVESPDWIAKEIRLSKGDTVVILDDDSSIHNAWKMRFKNHAIDIDLKHFTSGEEAIDFINTFSEKNKIFLLTDFELLKQELNGFHVIERTNIERAILVTSHYTNLVVRNLVIKNKKKILPKPLASEVLIKIEGSSVLENNEHAASKPKKINMVVIDDNKVFVDALVSFFESRGKIVNKYYNPIRFLEKISKYDKSTKFCIDNDLSNKVSGLELAKQLHEMGYTHLYLLSGKDFAEGEVPDYLTVILKTDTDKIYKLVE